MTDRLSRGNNRNSRHGPLIVSCLVGSSLAPVCCDDGMEESSAVDLTPSLLPSSLLLGADAEGTNMDFGRCSEVRLEAFSADGVPGLGAAINSLYELSVALGSFQGKRRSVMQANMMAMDQISVGCGSYLLWS